MNTSSILEKAIEHARTLQDKEYLRATVESDAYWLMRLAIHSAKLFWFGQDEVILIYKDLWKRRKSSNA